MIERFHERHEILYAYRDVVETEIINLKVVASGRRPKPEMAEQAFDGEDPSKALKGERKIFFEESEEFIPTRVYDGDITRNGNIISGPAIIEEKTTTIVIPPAFRVRVGRYGDYIMEIPL